MDPRVIVCAGQSMDSQLAHTCNVYAMTFTAGLSAFQVDQFNREINNQNFAYTQLVPSKLVAACNAHI